MHFSISFLIPLLAFSVSSTIITQSGRQVVLDEAIPKQGVPGHNHAYYTRVKREDQLLRIDDLTIRPDPPEPNQRVFLYMNVYAFPLRDEFIGLEEATLNITVSFADNYGPQLSFEEKIPDIPEIVVRRDDKYGGPLKLGTNEMLFDHFLLVYPLLDAFNCTVEAIARLPDQRMLFSFAQDFTFEGLPEE